MYKILLVDDERIIREGVARSVKWPDLYCELVGTARNGIEAYEMIRQGPPAVVITDIKMPGLDGLDLICRVKQEFPEVEFIILSGYGEFEFAKQAMSYGVKYYILKPCNEQKISEALRKVIKEIEQRKSRELYLKRIIDDFDKVNDYNIRRHNKWIHQVLKLIEDHLDKEELSLKWLAQELLYMNPDYLGKLFKREMKEKFSDYLLRVRMERAIYLVTATNLRIGEIAEKVGFGNNSQYFSQVFKKYTGSAPREYRMKMA